MFKFKLVKLIYGSPCQQSPTCWRWPWWGWGAIHLRWSFVSLTPARETDREWCCRSQLLTACRPRSRGTPRNDARSCLVWEHTHMTVLKILTRAVISLRSLLYLNKNHQGMHLNFRSICWSQRVIEKWLDKILKETTSEPGPAPSHLGFWGIKSNIGTARNVLDAFLHRRRSCTTVSLKRDRRDVYCNLLNWIDTRDFMLMLSNLNCNISLSLYILIDIYEWNEKNVK